MACVCGCVGVGEGSEFSLEQFGEGRGGRCAAGQGAAWDRGESGLVRLGIAARVGWCGLWCGLWCLCGAPVVSVVSVVSVSVSVWNVLFAGGRARGRVPLSATPLSLPRVWGCVCVVCVCVVCVCV